VLLGGFDRAVVPETARVSATGAAVLMAGFDRPVAQPAVLTVAPVARIDAPVEIVFKPVPAYTDEARRLRIEGTVVLDVEFTASSTVRVLRIVSGLGHGLDESASRAAADIRFNPARRGGVAADIRTTVQIVFRLT
jgi:TonB family protein